MKENIKLRRLKEIENKRIDNVKCPICNHPINWKEPVRITKEYVEFVAECWSGKLGTQGEPRHIFIIKVFEVPEVKLK